MKESLALKRMLGYFLKHLEKAPPLFFGLFCRLLTFIFFLIESLIMLETEQKPKSAFFVLIFFGSSAIIILMIKKNILEEKKCFLALVYFAEFCAHMELIFLENTRSSEVDSVSIWKYIGLLTLMNTHLMILSKGYLELIVKGFYIFYFLLRINKILDSADVFSVCFSLLCVFTELLKQTKDNIEHLKEKQKMRRLSKEAQLSAFLMKNYENNIIIDPLLLSANPVSIFPSLVSIIKNPTLRDDQYPIIQRKNPDNSLDIAANDPQSVNNFFKNFLIDETDQESFAERGPSFEQLILKISKSLLDSRMQAPMAPFPREIVHGKGTLKMPGDSNERAVEFIIYSFYEDNDIKKPLLFLILKDKTLNQENHTLKKFDAFKDRMLATVVHDMRAPLSLILSSIEITLRNQITEEVKETLELCEVNAKFLELLVSDILDFSLFKESKLNLICSNFSIQDTLNDCLSLIKIPATYKGLKLDIINPLSNELFYTDQRRLKQVIINLLTNSLKFTRSGSITITVEPNLAEHNQVLITVIDTGSGIKEENIKKLGSPFTSFDIQEEVNKNGIGLGLFISKTIISQLGPLSSFIVKTEENKGTAISFCIFKVIKRANNKRAFSGGFEPNPSLLDSPKITPRELKLQDTSRSAKTGIELADLNTIELNDETGFHDISLKKIEVQGKNPFCYSKKNCCLEKLSTLIKKDELEKKKLTNSNHLPCDSSLLIFKKLHLEGPLNVLVVDDNVFNSIVLESLLKKVGNGKIKIHKACDGLQAVEAFKSFNENGSKQPLHMIFMDCLMPIMDGLKATQKIKEMMGQGFEHVFVAGLTALQCTAEEREDCFQCGMDFIFQKPISEQTLREFLRNHL